MADCGSELSSAPSPGGVQNSIIEDDWNGKEPWVEKKIEEKKKKEKEVKEEEVEKEEKEEENKEKKTKTRNAYVCHMHTSLTRFKSSRAA
jgi:hypothetical protein